MLRSLLLLAPLAGAAVIGSRQDTQHCPGYKASNVQQSANSLTADLALAGKACNTYGTDLENLKLLVEYQTGMFNSIQIDAQVFILMNAR